MPLRAQAGHGATIAYEKDPVLHPGQFTVIAELNGDIKAPGLKRPVTESTPHQANIDESVTGVLQRDQMTFSVNWLFDDPTHDHETGVSSLIIRNLFTGWRVRGPGGSDNTDEMIGSGCVSAVTQTNPVRQGVRTSDITVVFSGPQINDGLLVGA